MGQATVSLYWYLCVWMSWHTSGRLDVWNFGCQDVSPSVFKYVCVDIGMSGYLSFLMEVCLDVCTFVYISWWLSHVCLYVGPSILRPVCVSGYLDVCLSIWISVWVSYFCLCVYIDDYMSGFLCLNVYFDLCLNVWMYVWMYWCMYGCLCGCHFIWMYLFLFLSV